MGEAFARECCRRVACPAPVWCANPRAERRSLQTDEIIFQIGVAPRRIDIITGLSALGFDEAFAGSCEFLMEGMKLRVPSVEALIRNKRATGRTKDLADVEALERLKTS